MSSITVRQLEYFLALAEEGNLADAAARLHVTAGTISSSVTALETVLGVQLFARQRAKGTSVSAAGRVLEPRIRAALSSVGAVEAGAASLRSELSGHLATGCFHTLAPWVMPPLLDHFASRHPGVLVEPVEGSADVLQEKVRSGQLDAAFVYHRHLDADLEREVVMPVRLQVVLPADHRLAQRSILRFAELADDPAILLDVHPTADIVTSLMAEAGLTPNIRWTLRNPDVIRSLVGRGLGYTVLMGRPQGDRTVDGAPLAYCRIEDEMPPNSVDLIFAPGARVDAKVRELVRFAANDLHHGAGPMQEAERELP